MQQIEQNPLYKENELLTARHEYLAEKIKEIELKEIEGYKIRVKYLAPYDRAEPDIAFYSKIEKLSLEQL